MTDVAGTLTGWHNVVEGEEGEKRGGETQS